MDFDLTADQQMFYEAARDFATKKLQPVAADMDEQGQMDAGILKEMAELGYFGMMVAEEYGGVEMDTIAYVLTLIEIAKACASTAAMLSVHNSLICDLLSKVASAEQKERYLAAVAKGERIGAFSLTEANAGSDAAAISCKARRQGDEYIINGNKTFVSNAQYAGLFLVFVRTAAGERTKGISALLVEKETPGLRLGKVEHKMGLRASSTCELIFEDCCVPARNLVGVEGAGFKVAMSLLEGGRIGIAAQSVGIAQAAFDQALAYAEQRIQFGKPIIEFQGVGFPLAEMKTEIEAAKLLLFKAAALKDQGRRCRLEAAAAKLYASEVANRVVAQAMQIFGGYGYIKDFPIERYYRDARITTLYEGTSQIQKMVILKELQR